jgi:hypothetical protein
MTSRLSYEEIRRLARTWFDEAREQSVRDNAEVAAWKKERPRNSVGGEFDWSSSSSDRDGGSGD